MTPRSIVYAVYLTASVFITVWVGRRLHRDGCPFLADVFRDRMRVGHAVNDSLLMGYYLLNIALDVLLLRRPHALNVPVEGLDWLAGRLGIVLVTLGTMHLVNVCVLLGVQSWLRRSAS